MIPPRRRTCLIVATVLALLGAGWLVWTVPPSNQPFLDYVADAESRGVVTTFEEFAGPMPAEAENGAPVLLAGYRDLVELHGPPSSWGVTGAWHGEGWFAAASEEERTLLADVLDARRVHLREIVEAAARPRIRFEIDSHSEPLFAQSHMDALIGIGRLIGTFAVASRDPEDRLDAMETALRIARMDRETGVLELLFATSLAAATVEDLRFRLEEDRIDPVLARDRVEPLLRAGCIPTIAEMARAERIRCIEMYRVIAGDGVLTGDPNVQRALRSEGRDPVQAAPGLVGGHALHGQRCRRRGDVPGARALRTIDGLARCADHRPHGGRTHH